MKHFANSIKLMLGADPTKPTPDDYSAEAREIHAAKRAHKETKEELQAIEEAHERSNRRHIWRKRRWITLALVNLLFVVSYYFDVQLLEGALTASRFIGFHMADLNSSLQVMLAFKHMVLNLVIGTVTIFILWFLLGGRTFCSWACPYHLLAEWAEMLHLKLVEKKWIKPVTFHRRARAIFYLLFALLALVTGYTVFETLSPTGIVSRALIYGPGLALVWVLLLLLFEVFISRRAWCRYVCPIGLTYGFVGSISPVRVRYNVNACHHEGNCRKVCLVPHVLEMTIKGRATDVEMPVGADCTRCGLCVDICPTDSLKFEVVGLKKLQ